MSMLTLQTPSQSEVTLLSNIFIDDYMPEAHGEFVKVYIYLLRALSTTPVSFTLEQMADHLLCTERDILRALKYWSCLLYTSSGHLIYPLHQNSTKKSAVTIDMFWHNQIGIFCARILYVLFNHYFFTTFFSIIHAAQAAVRPDL